MRSRILAPLLLQAALLLVFALIVSVCIAAAQPAQDTLYINLNTHAEESDNDPNGVRLDYSRNQAQYTQYRVFVKQIADMVRAKGAKWNYQSDWNFLDGGLKYDRGETATNRKNLFRWMAEDNNGQIQLDPHAHENSYNYADVAKLLDSLSPVVKSSKNAGGFTWNGPMGSSTLMGTTIAGYTWDSLGRGLRGRRFPTYTWRAEVLLGGATYNPRTMATSHGNDLNHVGAWKPRDTSSAGYMNHTCSSSLVNLGVGGDALFTTNGSIQADVAAIMTSVRANIAAMRANKGKFFVMQIQTNQRDFSRVGYMDKIDRILDSVNALVATGQVKWATHSEKLAAWKSLYVERPNFYPRTNGVDNCSASQTTLVGPTLLASPANGATNQPLTTTLRWNAVPNATLYDLHVAIECNFLTTVLRDSTIPASTLARSVGETFPGTTLYWRVRAKNATNTGAWSEGWNYTVTRGTSVSKDARGGGAFNIFPNPASELASIQFSLPETQHVSLKIINALGQEIASVLDETLPAGNHAIPLNTQHLSLNTSSTTLFVQLKTQHLSLNTLPLQVLR